jgi:phosphatidylserine/phosphatidylglycerophosphate/cardiolipin synthase-like enzyme
MVARKKVGVIFGVLLLLFLVVVYACSLENQNRKIGAKNFGANAENLNIGGQSKTPAPNLAANDTSNSSALSLIVEPDQGIVPILTAIKSAQKSVDVVMYELEDSKIEQALADDEARGVSVRVLLNGGYYGAPDNPNENETAYEFFSARGVPTRWTPARFALTHQKTMVVDGATAFIMTFNMTPQYYPTDRDFALVDAAAGDVSAIERTFQNDWQNENITALSGDDLVWSPGSENFLRSMIENAKVSLFIYNEEMADSVIVSALESAALRGVSVKVVMTDSGEWQKNFSALEKSGVQVRTFSSDAKLYIHAKMIVADGKMAFVGSQNFSGTSLNENRELGIVTTDQNIISTLSKTFVADFAIANVFQK